MMSGNSKPSFEKSEPGFEKSEPSFEKSEPAFEKSEAGLEKSEAGLENLNPSPKLAPFMTHLQEATPLRWGAPLYR